MVLKDRYIFNINKPKDWTSFDVVKKMRKITGIRKVGHGGTLDPFATGVLLILLGKATKEMKNLSVLHKEYEAELALGVETDTLDSTGKIINTAMIPTITKENLQQIFKKYTGEITQRIPDFSAAKIGGQPMYKLARKGIKIPDKYKVVNIYQLHLMDHTDTLVKFQVSCSYGTYIRALALDIAKSLGTVGFLKELTRTAIGNYQLKHSIEINNFQNKWIDIQKNEDLS